MKPPESPPALVCAESGEPRIPEAALRLDRDGVAAPWLVGDPPREWWDRLRREATRIRIVRPEGERLRRVADFLRHRTAKRRERRESTGIAAGARLRGAREPRIPEAALRLDRDGVAAPWLVGDPPREWWDRLRREATRIRIGRPEGERLRRFTEFLRLAP